MRTYRRRAASIPAFVTGVTTAQRRSRDGGEGSDIWVVVLFGSGWDKVISVSGFETITLDCRLRAPGFEAASKS